MRIVNEPENEGQYIVLNHWPKKFKAMVWSYELVVGFERSTWGLGVEVAAVDGSLRVVMLVIGPFYIGLLGER